MMISLMVVSNHHQPISSMLHRNGCWKPPSSNLARFNLSGLILVTPFMSVKEILRSRVWSSWRARPESGGMWWVVVVIFRSFTFYIILLCILWGNFWGCQNTETKMRWRWMLSNQWIYENVWLTSAWTFSVSYCGRVAFAVPWALLCGRTWGTHPSPSEPANHHALEPISTFLGQSWTRLR